jgi:hypothetical protein
MKGDARQYKRDRAFRPVIGGQNPRIHAGFGSAQTRGRRNDAEPQSRPAVKSRAKADSAKCKKSLHRKTFGAADESLF